MAKEVDKKTKKVKRPTALKRDDQSEKRRQRNRIFKSTVRTAVRDFEEVLKKGDKDRIQEQVNVVYSMMDKGVKRGVYKKNKASRTKSRIAARLAVASV